MSNNSHEAEKLAAKDKLHNIAGHLIDEIADAKQLMECFYGANDGLPEDLRGKFQEVAEFMAPLTTHGGVSYQIDLPNGETRTYPVFNEAAAIAVINAFSNGQEQTIDALCNSQEAADSIGEGDSHRNDPDASVTARIVIKAEHKGRIA